MKILFATTTFNPITHGPAKFAHFVLQINRRYPHHEVRILTEGIDQAIPGLIYKMVTNYYRPFGALWPLFDNINYYRRITEIKKTYDFDILLFNNAIQGLWSKKKLASSVTVAGMLNDSKYLSENLSTIRWDRMWIVNRYRRTIEYYAVKNLDLTITNSYSLKEKILKTYQASPEKVVRLYKSIDLNKIKYKNKYTISTNKTINILFVKANYLTGGLAILAEALALLTNYKFHLTIIGPTKNHTQTILSYFKNKKNIRPDYLGPKSQEFVFSALNQHDIFCVPSYEEALGVANIEALAAGVPVVSTQVGGIPEVLDQGNNGWLCIPGDAQSLADTIRDCIENENERHKKSQAGRAFVDQNFRFEKMLDRLIDLLNSIKKI